MDWSAKGYLSPSPELIIDWLPYTVLTNRRNKWKYRIEGLIKHAVTYEEHIWWLFRNPSQMYKANSCYTDEVKKSGNSWIKALQYLVEEKKIERAKVLSEALNAITRQPNKHEAGFFISLFQAFNPTEDELLLHQDHLLELSSSCIHSRPVTISLQYLKKLCTYPTFHLRQYIDQLPMLLSKEGKAILLIILDTAGKIMEKENKQIPEILPLLPTAFLNKDETVQKKAAQLLTTFGSPTEHLCSELRNVEATILMSIRPILKEYLSNKPIRTQPEEVKPVPAFAREQLKAENKIPDIDTLEDMIFHLSHAFLLKTPVDFDRALNALVQLNYLVTEKKLILFEPVLKKAYKVYTEQGTTTIQYLYTSLLIHYGEFLKKQYPGSFAFTDKLKEKAIEKENTNHWRSDSWKEKFLKLWGPFHSIPADNAETEVFHQLALYTLDKIKKGDQLPLLSTPTHYPAWIDPVVLTDRLSLYHEQDVAFHELDLQLAIQRCALDHPEKAIESIPDKLSGEVACLMNYFLQPETTPEAPFNLLSCWVTAGITRKGELDAAWKDSIYKRIPGEYLSGIHKPEMEIKSLKSGLPVLSFAKERYNPEKEPDKLFMEYNSIQITAGLTPVMILSNPNRPGNIYRNILSKVCRYRDDSWEIGEIQTMLPALQLMRELQNPYGDMEHLMLAVSVLSKSKDVLNLGWEIWIEGVEQNRINNKQLGHFIGWIEAKEIHPIKRLSDRINILTSQLGTSHIQALYQLTEAVLSELPEKPIRNQKKLLDVYNELLLLTGTSGPTYK